MFLMHWTMIYNLSVMSPKKCLAGCDMLNNDLQRVCNAQNKCLDVSDVLDSYIQHVCTVQNKMS